MRPLLVSQTDPRGMRTVGDAFQVPMPPGMLRHVMVQPGHYPGFWVPAGVNCVVTAVAGPGSVTVGPVGDAATIKVMGDATLQGLNVSGGGEAALWSAGGSVLAERCTFVAAHARGGVYASGGGPGRPGRLALRGCRVRELGVVYEDASGLIEDTEIRDVRSSGVEMERSTLEMRRCRIQHAGNDGLRVLAGSRLVLDRTHISDVKENGLLQGDSDTTITGTRIERAEAGVHYGRGPMTARNLTVEDVATIGVFADVEATGAFEHVAVRRAGKIGLYAGSVHDVIFTSTLVESCEVGIFGAEGSRATLHGTTVRAGTGYGMVLAPGLAALLARGCEITANAAGVVNADLPGVVLENTTIHNNPGGDHIRSPQH